MIRFMFYSSLHRKSWQKIGSTFHSSIGKQFKYTQKTANFFSVPLSEIDEFEQHHSNLHGRKWKIEKLDTLYYFRLVLFYFIWSDKYIYETFDLFFCDSIQFPLESEDEDNKMLVARDNALYPVCYHYSIHSLFLGIPLWPMHNDDSKSMSIIPRWALYWMQESIKKKFYWTLKMCAIQEII